jgi:hypothetical protein
MFEAVFMTSYSDYCFQAIPAIAQMADDVPLKLTIVHTLPPGSSIGERKGAQARIESFFPEADAFAQTERRVMSGSPLEAVRRLGLEKPLDLLLAPASERLGFPRIGHRSQRCQFLRESGIPLWSIGRKTELPRIHRRPKNVACWLDFDRDCARLVACAMAYARKLEANMHILCALPEIHEGSVFLDNEPLTVNGAVAEVNKRISWLEATPKIHVARSDNKSARKQLLRQCDADLLFVSDWSRSLPAWLAPKPKFMDDSPVPVIWVPEHSDVVWDLNPQRASSNIAAKSSADAARGESLVTRC